MEKIMVEEIVEVVEEIMEGAEEIVEVVTEEAEVVVTKLRRFWRWRRLWRRWRFWTLMIDILFGSDHNFLLSTLFCKSMN